MPTAGLRLNMQGLLTPDGLIQCAYHGWKFDGTSGECQDIPQLQSGWMPVLAVTPESKPLACCHHLSRRASQQRDVTACCCRGFAALTRGQRLQVWR